MDNIKEVTACYKTIDENTVSAILEVNKDDKFETIFKYTFSINSAEKNTIDIYKEISLKELYDIYMLVRNNPNFKGVFDIYFNVYQNEINNLRSFAIQKLNEVNDPKVEKKENIFSKIKGTTKTLFKEMMNEGSTNELNGNIIRVAVYKKDCPENEIGKYLNRYAIDVIRFGTDAWENIYSYEYGKYTINNITRDINSVSVYKKLEEIDIFKIISLLNTDVEYEIMIKYLKTTPKEPHGDTYEKQNHNISEIENIKFL